MERVQDNKQCSLVFEQLFKQHYRALCFHAMSLVNDLDASKDIVVCGITGTPLISLAPCFPICLTSLATGR